MTRTRAAQGDVTRLLLEWSGGDLTAEEELWPLVYDELKKLARHVLRRRPRRLDTTVLVHEAYLRLVGNEQLAWNDRGHFFAIAARAMRFILVDHARRERAAKHGGGAVPVPLDEALGQPLDIDVDVLALDDALKGLKELDARQSQIVELSYFGGLTYDEIGRTLEVSPATVKRELRTARMWLRRQMENGAR